MDVYLVIGYFKYEGCEPICVCGTLERAKEVCVKHVKSFDGVEVIKLVLDVDEEGVDVYHEVNRV